MDPVIGSILFVDGFHRDVYLDEDGKQYVKDDDDGHSIFGVWIFVDEPEVITMP